MSSGISLKEDYCENENCPWKKRYEDLLTLMMKERGNLETEVLILNTEPPHKPIAQMSPTRLYQMHSIPESPSIALL